MLKISTEIDLSTAIFFLIIVILLVILGRFLYQKNDFIKFLATGLDSGFKIKEIYLLYQAASFANIPEPISLFLSVPALNNCIAYIVKDAQDHNLENNPKILNFIEKLYKYRTKVELDPKNSHSMKTTKSLKTGQKLRIVLKGFGVFSSKVVNNGRDLLITLPLQKNIILISGSEWVGRSISVYLQRAGDAGYVFDTIVKDVTAFNGATVLILEHTENLIRSQKRRSVRCACSITGQLYIVKCLIEDISEDGALIRIGGKGQKNIKIKLQFLLGNNMIVMFGVVKAVEYNATTNQSRLHFESVTLPQKMKNEILSYVYNVIPQEQKDAYDAMIQAENDATSENPSDETDLTKEKDENQEVQIENKSTELQNQEKSQEKESEIKADSEEKDIPTEKFEEFLKNETQNLGL